MGAITIGKRLVMQFQLALCQRLAQIGPGRGVGVNGRFGGATVDRIQHPFGTGQTGADVGVDRRRRRPRVGVINNGIRKGGQPETMRVLHSSPGLEDLWQGHVAQLSGAEYAIPGMFVANIVEDPEHRPAYWIKVSALADGSFSVTNSRNGFSKKYGVP